MSIRHLFKIRAVIVKSGMYVVFLIIVNSGMYVVLGALQLFSLCCLLFTDICRYFLFHKRLKKTRKDILVDYVPVTAERTC